MKSGKWAKLTILTICVMCMVLNPMCVYAVDAGTGDTEKTTESEINTEVTPEADITPKAEVTPEAEVSPQPVRMLLMGAAPVNDEINISTGMFRLSRFAFFQLYTDNDVTGIGIGKC